MIKSSQNQKAFVLLYAVLVSGIVLSVGLSLVNLLTKQIILSSIGRESQFAYYAADAGKQCAYFWINNYDIFGAYDPNNPDVGITPPEEGGLPLWLDGKVVIFCHRRDNTNPSESGIPITYNLIEGEMARLESEFELDMMTDDGRASCAKVEVIREMVIDDQGRRKIRTEINSKGYNTSCSDVNPGSGNQRRIERVVHREISE